MQTSDNEQIQMLRDWWKRYGGVVLVIILVFVVTNFGWRYWQNYQHRRAEHASADYTQMLIAFEQKKDDEGKLYAKRLMDNNSNSVYASLAAFMLAKNAVQTGDLKLAQEQLQVVIKKSSDATLRQIARIRCARILLATKQPKLALELLAIIDDAGYQVEISEASGDVLLALDRVAEAKQAYQKAKELMIDDNKSPLLQLKMQQL